MRTMAAALLMITSFSGAAFAGPGGPGGGQQGYGQQGQQQGGSPQDYRRGDDQIGAFAQMSELLRAGYRIVAAYEGGLILARDDRVFVCAYTQYREGGGGGVRLVSQGCNEVREPRDQR
jgi:hypothetical protein